MYDQVRTAHLERIRQVSDVSILYHDERYDFDRALLEGLDVRRVNAFELAVLLLRNPVEQIEINEPMLHGGLPRAALASLVRSVKSFVQLQPPPRLVAYAIGNRNTRGDRNPGIKGRLRHAADFKMAGFIARRLDRIVYGTQAASDNYLQAFGLDLNHIESKVIPALPEACSCQGIASADARVLFVGAFTERKGLYQLLQAWPHVTATCPDAHLALIGKGPLQALAENAARGEPSITISIDPPRNEIHRELRRARVLVLLSQPAPRWREQVGLPITEGLAHGCQVLATTETGLADWLKSHAHTVVPPDATPQQIGQAIIALLQSGRSKQSVLDDLPDVDGRLEADQWLRGSSGVTTTGKNSKPVD